MFAMLAENGVRSSASTRLAAVIDYLSNANDMVAMLVLLYDGCADGDADGVVMMRCEKWY